MRSSAAGAQMPDLDLAAYFARIGYDGPVRPTLEALRAVHRLHPQAIPFENLDPFLHHPVDLSLAALQQKLVRSRRGGYCYEHGLLFVEVLKELGFKVSGLGARVLWNVPEGTTTARSHMLLRIDLDDHIWLADVGFGGLTMTGPLLLEPDIEQQTPHELMRLVEADGYFRLEAKIGNAWQKLYRFDLHELFDVDYAVSNYFLSTNPNSQFRTRLIAARALPEGRLALMNNRLSTYRLNGAAERRDLADAAELADVLETQFGIELPDQAAFSATAREKLFEAKP
jgi:N-hydroxyarylamine O-acetyltransferase